MNAEQDRDWPRMNAKSANLQDSLAMNFLESLVLFASVPLWWTFASWPQICTDEHRFVLILGTLGSLG